MNQSQFLAITPSKRGKNHAYMVRLVLVFALIGWKTGASLRNHVITFDSHSETALYAENNYASAIAATNEK